MNDGAPRHITLCADDYGISPAVSAAIRDLIARGRLNATSVMVVSPHFTAAEADTLGEVAASRAAIGLHVTLTGLFTPLAETYAPLHHGTFFPLAGTVLRAQLRALRPDSLTAEIGKQFEAFRQAFGRPPDYVDGHQHVHLFPQIRDALLQVIKAVAPDAWVRQCGQPAQQKSWRDPKGLFLDGVSRRFHRMAQAAGLRTNPAFSGTYAFAPADDYAALFPRFLDGMPDGGLVMCHPGKVDAALRALDPLTDLREREYDYFCSDAFSRLLAERGVRL